MIIRSCYSYLYDILVNGLKPEFSLEKLPQIEYKHVDFIKHEDILTSIKGTTINSNDVIYLAKFAYIPDYVLTEFSDLKFTNNINECTKIVYNINNLLDIRNSFHYKLENGDYISAVIDLFENNMSKAFKETKKYIPYDGIYKIWNSIGTTDEEYNYILKNLTKIINRMSFLEYLSRKQQVFDLKTYNEVVKLIQSPEIEIRLMALMTLTNFSLFNEDNKPYFESIFVHYDTYLHDLKHTHEYLYFTNGYSTYNKTHYTKERWII